MANTTPELPVKVNLVSTTKGTTTRNQAHGRKLPWFLSAARTRSDRDYTPRLDIMQAGE